MTPFLLDTSVCVAALRDPQCVAARRIAQLQAGQVFISALVLAELEFGLSLSAKKAQNRVALHNFLEYIPVEDWPAGAAVLYGEVRAAMRTAGAQIGAVDFLIGIHALSRAAMVITDNEKDFRRVPGLKVENWLKA